MRRTNCAALALSATLAALPALAATAPTATGTATVDHTTAAQPSQRNPLLADNGDVRMSKLVGTNVYNSQDQKLGSIDDVLLSKTGTPDVIMKVNGKLVQVPWNELQFGNAQQNSDNKVILPNAAQNALNNQQEFHYHANGNG